MKYLWAWLALGIIAIDQLTKFWIRSMIELGGRVNFLPILDFTHHLNTGAGSGILRGWNSALIWISVMAIGVILYYIMDSEKNIQLSLGVLAGGVVGNLIDRIMLSGVTDFLLFHVGNYAWPSFNVADTAITFSISLLVFYEWKK